MFINWLTKIKFEIWRVTFFFTTEKYGMDFQFAGNNENIECALHRCSHNECSVFRGKLCPPTSMSPISNKFF